MQEEPPNQPNRIDWKFYQIIVMLLPGIIFLTLFPVYYADALEKAGQEILNDPKTWPPETALSQLRVDACIRTGTIMAAGMALGMLIVSFTQPTRRRMIRKALLALGFMTAANLLFCGGGFALGLHTNSSLEEALGRIKNADAGTSPAFRAEDPESLTENGLTEK